MAQGNKKMEQKKGNMATKEEGVLADKSKVGMDANPMNAKRSDALDSDGEDRKRMNDQMESGKRDIDIIDEEKGTMTGKASSDVNPLEPDHGETLDSDIDIQENSMRPELKRKEIGQDT